MKVRLVIGITLDIGDEQIEAPETADLTEMVGYLLQLFLPNHPEGEPITGENLSVRIIDVEPAVEPASLN